jgi:hypothetical protein
MKFRSCVTLFALASGEQDNANQRQIRSCTYGYGVMNCIERTSLWRILKDTKIAA